jgi:outer membrane protein assembly factor BamD
MLEVVTQRLVRHELYVARYYLVQNNFKAATARCEYALANFAGSGLDAEALVLKGETLLKMQKDDEARATFQLVINQHGGPFGRVAERFLAKMAPAAADEKGSAPIGSSSGASSAPEEEQHGDPVPAGPPAGQ